MEEILASIRRIISDDESTSRQRPAKTQDDEGLEAAEGEADDKIIDDIARVLSSSAPAVEDEEDILDLTAELGGAEIVEDVEILEEVLIVDAPAPVEMPPFRSAELSAAMPEQAEFEPEAAAQPAPPLSASEEAASALERAIAALRAGQLPTSVGEFMPASRQAPEPQFSAAAPEPEFELVPEFDPVPEFEAVPAFEPASEAEGALEFEPEPQLVLTDFTVETVEEIAPAEPPVESVPKESAFRSQETPPWARTREPPVEPERASVFSNGGSSHGASPLETSHKSLEDSVKDMLRPMLRQWLDENMPRMVTAALKDELGERQGRGRSE